MNPETHRPNQQTHRPEHGHANDPQTTPELTATPANNGHDLLAPASISNSTPTSPGKPRLGRRKFAQLLDRLSRHDQAVLTHLYDCRFATSHQLARSFQHRYTTSRSATRQTNRQLNRFAELTVAKAQPRRVGGHQSGSAANIWTLSAAGQRVVEHLNDQPTGQRRSREPSATFMAHMIGVAELHTQLLEAEHARQLSIDSITHEPRCWRTYLTSHGTTGTLKPDLHAVTTSLDGYEDHYFFELDRSTENPQRIVAKCQAYQNYHDSGQEQQQHGVFPRVIWVTLHPSRKEQLTKHLSNHDDLLKELFTVTTLDNFRNQLTNPSEGETP